MKRALNICVILVVTAILSSPLWGATEAKKGPDKAPYKLAPVMLAQELVFTVPAFQTLNAAERAARISERLAKIAEDMTVSLDDITEFDGEVSTDIVAGERVIMSVYDTDARLYGVTRQEVAKVVAGKTRTAVEKYRQERAPKNIVHGILLTLAATVVLLAVLVLERYLFKRLLAWLEARKSFSIHFQKFEILQLEQVKRLFIGVIRALRLVIILVILYFYAYATLGFFPWTRPFSGQILHYLLVPLGTMERGVISYIPNLIFLVVLSLVTCYLLKFMQLFFEEIRKGNIAFAGFYPEWARPTYKIARFLLIIFVAVVAFPYFPGSNSPAFKGISIFLGVLLSLGSSSTISNIIAGLDMTYRRAYLTGDWIKIGDLVGEVTRMRLLVTHLRTFKNEEVVFPNALLLSSHVTNYSFLARDHGLILHTAVTIGYTTPWRQVHAFLLQAAEQTPGLLREPRPFVLQTALDDFYVRYELNAYTNAPEKMLAIYSDLHQNIQDAFNEYGVQIMSPHYMLDPRSPAIVPKEHWYAPPAKGPEENAGGESRP